jgi:hypothetical protein
LKKKKKKKKKKKTKTKTTNETQSSLALILQKPPLSLIEVTNDLHFLPVFCAKRAKFSFLNPSLFCNTLVSSSSNRSMRSLKPCNSNLIALSMKVQKPNNTQKPNNYFAIDTPNRVAVASALSSARSPAAARAAAAWFSHINKNNLTNHDFTNARGSSFSTALPV